jgi:putative phosphoribosyl transferase
MKNRLPENVVDIPELRNEIYVYVDRTEAGGTLAGMLKMYKETDAVVLAVPAGGVPVGAVIAQDLSLTLDVLVVSKITLPWNTEAGYGAVAFDGTVRLNERLLPRLGLREDEIQHGIEQTRKKVARRFRNLRGDKPFPDLSKRPVIVVDDGLASGFTHRPLAICTDDGRSCGVCLLWKYPSRTELCGGRRLSEMVRCD